MNEGQDGLLTVHLGRELTGDDTVLVTVEHSSGDADLSLGGLPSVDLLFDATNWDTGVPVTIEAADDEDIANGTARFLVSASGWAPAWFTATEQDDDQGIEASLASHSVAEGDVATYQVRLKGPPEADVMVTTVRTSGDDDLNILTGGTLLFTPGTWSEYQAVTLAAAIFFLLAWKTHEKK